MTIGLLIPTYNAEKELRHLLDSVTKTTCINKILVIDSASKDRTQKIVQSYNVPVHTISQSEFNHGATRELGRKLLNTDLVVMMTQDVIPCREDMLSLLIEPIITGKASVSYARQLPRENADLFEAFPRKFNYPETSHIRSIEDKEKYGVYTFFCSDSCSAYLNSALDEIGGFPSVLTHEDYFVVAQLLQKGHKIAYVAEAKVMHSHRYTLLEEFQRYYDAGFVRGENPWVNRIVGKAEGRGKDLFVSMMKEIVKQNISLLPYFFLVTIAKYFGYKLGQYAVRFPPKVQMSFSKQKWYWSSRHYKGGRQ